MRRINQTFYICGIAVGLAIAAVWMTDTDQLLGKSFLYESQPINVVRVDDEHVRNNQTDKGSGCLIRGDLVLSAYHVVRDHRAGDKVKIRFSTDLVREGTIIKVDPKWDLSLIRIKPVLYPVVRPAGKSVMKGQTVNICGFPHGNEYAERRARVQGFRSPGPRDPQHMFTVRVRSESGMSGGPVFNDGGELVGVLFGTGTYSNCTGLQAIARFLKGVDLDE